MIIKLKDWKRRYILVKRRIGKVTSLSEISCGLVSIIMPAYNSEKYIEEAINSVINQTYKNWELIIVDDNSIDDTRMIVKRIAEKDVRINYIKLNINSGAAVARNTAINNSHGKYIAFLDSDDRWYPKKLERQLSFMVQNNYAFTCTMYDKINKKSERIQKVVPVYPKLGYKGILKHNLGNSTVIYNSEILGKQTIPNIKKRNDYVMWLQIIKDSNYLYGLDSILSSHRIRPSSLSQDKISLVKYHWKVYREIEKLSIIKSSYLVFYWIYKTIRKFVAKHG